MESSETYESGLVNKGDVQYGCWPYVPVDTFRGATGSLDPQVGEAVNKEIPTVTVTYLEL